MTSPTVECQATDIELTPPLETGATLLGIATERRHSAETLGFAQTIRDKSPWRLPETGSLATRESSARFSIKKIPIDMIRHCHKTLVPRGGMSETSDDRGIEMWRQAKGEVTAPLETGATMKKATLRGDCSRAQSLGRDARDGFLAD